MKLEDLDFIVDSLKNIGVGLLFIAILVIFIFILVLLFHFAPIVVGFLATSLVWGLALLVALMFLYLIGSLIRENRSSRK